MFGGCFLAYEGAHKLHARLTHHEPHESAPAVLVDDDHERQVVAGAVRTDFILSAEIMVIALKEVLDEGFVSRAIILLIVAFVITAVVYGVVALIVKMDDVGVRMATSGGPRTARIGHALVAGMPKLLSVLSVVGTAAMLWVGGHILIAGAEELGWHWPHDVVHSLEELVADVPAIGGVLAWLVNTAVSAAVGLAVGMVLVMIVSRLPRRGRQDAHAVG
jgi:hypothetical protein